MQVERATEMVGTTQSMRSRAGRLRRLTPAWLGVAALCVLTGAMLAGPPARAQSGADILRGALAIPDAGSAQRSNTDASPGAPGTQTGQVTLVALVSEESRQRIDQGLIWRVFSPGGSAGRPKLLSTSRDAQPVLRLAPGDYLVNAAFGRAFATKRVKVAAGAQTTETFHLNAGVLRLTAFSSTGERLSDANVRYEIQSDERDQFGQRPRIVGNLRPGMLVRLNSGLYHIVSVYGDANARATADLTVEPAKLSDVVLVHHAAKVTFKLVQRAGGEAMADTQWSIATRNGQVVKESAGALPVHTLAPGSYVVSASSAGRIFRRNFVVKSGESAFVEVLMQ